MVGTVKWKRTQRLLATRKKGNFLCVLTQVVMQLSSDY